ARGYPELLQVAEPYRGGILTDRQHPHDLISELSVGFEHPVGSRVGASLYAAPVGEPALGPVAYPHRPSAVYDPATPLGHHTQDFTHTTFGVVTLGGFTRQVRVEASAFNGAHPDDVRTNFDPVRLDSYSARLSWNPASQWSVAAWFGHVAATGGAHVHGALDRFGASVLHSRGTWSTTLVYGADLPAGAGHPLNTLLLESTLELGDADEVYGRAEYVRRTAADLALVGSVSRELDIGAVSLGYERALWRSALVATGVGARGTLNLADGGIAGQTRQVLENIKAVLAFAGSSLDRAVKCTVFLADIQDFAAMNAVYATYFPKDPPARSTVAASGLAGGARVEIECIATAG